MENEKRYIVSRKKKNIETQYLTENKKWDFNKSNAAIFDSRYKANTARIKSFVDCIRESYPANQIKVESI